MAAHGVWPGQAGGVDDDAATPTSETISGELYEEDTILGDFLRAIREHEESPARALNLATFLPDLGKHRALASALQAVDRDERRVLLQEAAALGLDLLSGEESLAVGSFNRDPTGSAGVGAWPVPSGALPVGSRLNELKRPARQEQLATGRRR